MAEGSAGFSSPLQLLSTFSRIERLRHSNQAHCARPGSRLLLRIQQTDETCILQLVLPAEAAPEQQRISVLSPLGAALLGLSPGESQGESVNIF
ncbi:GreA/GreB family elongation factor [Marinobacterium sp. A346]|uniref:GreA/GreB family elongation factor n=2 Tax=Marinobacterium weihaiense TaxID=2851016 RepID=A0ABS6MDM4_9GAMM|nr:GreA/GreB family elongation factor [Marinobacterium weihaiense]